MRGRVLPVDTVAVSYHPPSSWILIVYILDGLSRVLALRFEVQNGSKAIFYIMILHLRYFDRIPLSSSAVIVRRSVTKWFMLIWASPSWTRMSRYRALLTSNA